MAIRFSIRSLLATMAYVALAIAAISTKSYLLVNLVWCGAIVTLCYAIVASFVGSNHRRAMALGFVVLAVANLAGTYLTPTQVPTMQIFRAAGYRVDSGNKVVERDPDGMWRTSESMTIALRTANGVATVIVGLIGCFIGHIAYRQGIDNGETDSH